MSERGSHDLVAELEARNRLLAEAEQRLRRIIDSLADSVVVVDGDGSVKFANPAAEALFGRPRSEVVGDHFGLPLVAGRTTEVDLTGGRSAEMRVVEVQWGGQPAWLASLRDVSDRKEAEEAERSLWRERAAREAAEAEKERLEELRRSLEDTMDRLREEERRKDHFLAVLGHELRNPLAGFDSGLQLLERGVEGDRRDWTLEMMRRQVGAIRGLLDDLLDVSAIARGKLELERRRLDLGAVVDAAVASAGPTLEANGQHLEVSRPEDPVAVDGDARRLQQVIVNLLVNSAKYSDRGSTIGLRLRGDGARAAIEVEDRGKGLDGEMLERIFDPFFQASSSETPTAEGGLGIGLTLVRQLVELHGGTVTASSPGPGKGSTFTVLLPAGDGAEAVAAAAPKASERGASRGLRVLVVDDNEDAATALAELLELEGFETATAFDGAEALARLRDERFEAALLDLDLPEVSGFKVAERLRKDPEQDGILLVAVSGFGQEKLLEHSRANGFDEHLVKPVDLDRLLALLREVAGKRTARRD